MFGFEMQLKTSVWQSVYGVLHYNSEVGLSKFTTEYVTRNAPLKSKFQVGQSEEPGQPQARHPIWLPPFSGNGALRRLLATQSVLVSWHDGCPSHSCWKFKNTINCAQRWTESPWRWLVNFRFEAYSLAFQSTPTSEVQGLICPVAYMYTLTVPCCWCIQHRYTIAVNLLSWLTGRNQTVVLSLMQKLLLL